MAVRQTRQMKKQSLERNLAEYERIDSMLTQMKAQLEELRGEIIQDLDSLGLSSERTDYAIFSIRNAGVRVTIDRDKLETLFPNVYAQVAKTAKTKRALAVRKVKLSQNQ